MIAKGPRMIPMHANTPTREHTRDVIAKPFFNGGEIGPVIAGVGASEMVMF